MFYTQSTAKDHIRVTKRAGDGWMFDVLHPVNREGSYPGDKEGWKVGLADWTDSVAWERTEEEESLACGSLLLLFLTVPLKRDR